MSSDNRLTDSDNGVWEVVTETSTYELDLDRKVGRRFPGRGVTSLAPELFISALEHDGEEWEIVTLLQCAIGEPMHIVAIGIDHEGMHETARRSTMVRAIKSLV